MPDIKVVKDATVKDVEQVFAVGSSNTLYSVNYVVRYTFTIFKKVIHYRYFKLFGMLYLKLAE